jgi:hypothetical protein
VFVAAIHPIGDDGGQPMLNQPVAMAAKRVRTPPAAAAIMALTHSFMASSSIAISGSPTHGHLAVALAGYAHDRLDPNAAQASERTISR